MAYKNNSEITNSWFKHVKQRICFCHFCACMLHHFSRVQLSATLWTVARQAPLFMGFSRQEYWSGLPCPPPGDLPDPGIEPTSLASLASLSLAGGFFTIWVTREALYSYWPYTNDSLRFKWQAWGPAGSWVSVYLSDDGWQGWVWMTSAEICVFSWVWELMGGLRLGAGLMLQGMVTGPFRDPFS